MKKMRVRAGMGEKMRVRKTAEMDQRN